MNNLLKLSALTLISGLTSWFLGHQISRDDFADNEGSVQSVQHDAKLGNAYYGPLSNNLPKYAEGYNSPTHNRNK